MWCVLLWKTVREPTRRETARARELTERKTDAQRQAQQGRERPRSERGPEPRETPRPAEAHVTSLKSGARLFPSTSSSLPSFLFFFRARAPTCCPPLLSSFSLCLCWCACVCRRPLPASTGSKNKHPRGSNQKPNGRNPREEKQKRARGEITHDLSGAPLSLSLLWGSGLWLDLCVLSVRVRKQRCGTQSAY